MQPFWWFSKSVYIYFHSYFILNHIKKNIQSYVILPKNSIFHSFSKPNYTLCPVNGLLQYFTVFLQNPLYINYIYVNNFRRNSVLQISHCLIVNIFFKHCTDKSMKPLVHGFAIFYSQYQLPIRKYCMKTRRFLGAMQHFWQMYDFLYINCQMELSAKGPI